ncbi:YitT family protein [Faecalimonas canis]
MKMNRKWTETIVQRIMDGLSWRKIVYIVIGAVICSFGIYNIHQQTGVTEGGVIGTMLLINHWLGFKPSVITPILDISCYLFAYKFLGARFIKISVVSTMSVSFFFKIWEQFPPILPNLSAYPFVSAVLGGVFVGVGVGLIVRQGGSSGGDDALALAISKVTHWRLSRAYMFTDFTVLILSLSYIPVGRIVFSIITVTVSSYIIDFVQQYGRCQTLELEEG